MNLVLIGYRGTGKTTVGKILAEQLARGLVSTDGEVIKRAGRSIPDIVQHDGWEHFRGLEAEVCRDLGAQDGLVIDTGGGAILKPENVVSLKKKWNAVLAHSRGILHCRTDPGRYPAPSFTGLSITRTRSDELPTKHSTGPHVDQQLAELEPGQDSLGDLDRGLSVGRHRMVRRTLVPRPTLFKDLLDLLKKGLGAGERRALNRTIRSLRSTTLSG